MPRERFKTLTEQMFYILLCLHQERRGVEILLPCSYAQYERVKLETEGFGGVIAEADYGADIALTVLLPEERWEDYLAHMLDITAGTVEGMVCGERFQDVPWRAPREKEE